MTEPLMISHLEESQFDAAIRAAAEQYPPGNPEGVVGATIAHRCVGGRPGSEVTVTLLVERKLEEPTTPIQNITFEDARARFVLRPDIEAIGLRDTFTRSGPRLPYSGLHAGCSILVRGEGVSESGAVACLLSTGTAPTHLLTAGHLFPRHAEGKVQVFAGTHPDGDALEIGVLQTNLLDTSERRDVALVKLSEQGRALAKATPRQGPRLAPTPLDTSRALSEELRAFLPHRHAYARAIETEYVPGTFHIKGDCRPMYTLEGKMLQTSHVGNIPGDSGAPLVTYAGSAGTCAAVGIVIAVLGSVSLYEPIDRALERLSSAIGQTFHIL